MSKHGSRGRPTLWRILLASLTALAFASPGAAAEPDVRLIADESGQKLRVDGEDYMVFGMNWGYMPIGENYNYNLWAYPDDVIEAALAREMPLLQEMGVNSIRQYVGIPPRWVQYIYETYGITTMLNHLVGRYGYTLEGTWIPSVDYSDPAFRRAVTAEVVADVEKYRDTPGVLMWLLGNENNYGLHWSSFEIEALPEGERDEARARYLYTLYEEITKEIKKADPEKLVAISNGDLQYIDIIAEECGNLDILGTNVYRGISARDLFQVVSDKLDIPVMFTEFGADAYNAREMREDQLMQAKYHIGQWQEIYEQSYGKGRVGNAIGGYIFQWSDGWWKFGQESRLDIHDTNASWPNGGYIEDYVPGQNNMNEEWWGIAAKGPPDHRSLYEVYPRAAYYALRKAFRLDPYAPATDLEAIRAHFATITPSTAALEAKGDRAAMLGEPRDKVHLSGLRMEFETYNTGGDQNTRPEWFDHKQSFYVDAEARPSGNVTGTVSLNIRGNVPVNPIDETFYENRGILFLTSSGEVIPNNRVRVYQGSLTWDDKWFMADGFYRTGHLHWGFEGDFFGLYRDAYYGENIDIHDARTPVGFEIAGKRHLEGLKVAFGPELWWAANPAVFVKYNREIGPFDATAVYHEDIAQNRSTETSGEIPERENRKVTLQVATRRGPWGFEVGGIWSGGPRVGDSFVLVEEDGDETLLMQDDVQTSDAFGAKGKITWEKGRWHWYAQGARMGLVADAGPTEVITFTDWQLKDSGSGNQTNFMTGVAVNVGNFQISPNFLWQEPIVGPVPPEFNELGQMVWASRNIDDDIFVVRDNRETVGGELIITYDPTPATWFWAWDNDVRENAPLAASLGFVYRHLPTTQDAGLFFAEDGTTIYAFSAAPPAEDLWELNARVVSRLSADSRLVATAYFGKVQPKGYIPHPDDVDPEDADPTVNRTIERFGAGARITRGPLALETSAKFNDWGPYDYHEDFNLTYPLQLMGDVSYSLGSPSWFEFASTRLGVRTTWRSLDEHSPRYVPDGSGENGSEWEVRTYVHMAL